VVMTGCGHQLHSVLEEIFDADFTASNSAFVRAEPAPGHPAAAAAGARSRDWAVAVDLQAFFDEIPHGLILQLIRRKVGDEQFVTLLVRLLKAGSWSRGCLRRRPRLSARLTLSPILSNLVLNELDHKLEERNWVLPLGG